MPQRTLPVCVYSVRKGAKNVRGPGSIWGMYGEPIVTGEMYVGPIVIGKCRQILVMGKCVEMGREQIRIMHAVLFVESEMAEIRR